MWRRLADLEDGWNPVLSRSKVVGSPARGVGTRRESRLAGEDGHFHERVVEWVDGRWMTTEVTDTSLPIASAKMVLGVEPCGESSTTVVFVLEYEPRRAAVSRFGGVLVLRARLCKLVHNMADGLKRAVEEASAPSALAGRPLSLAK